MMENILSITRIGNDSAPKIHTEEQVLEEVMAEAITRFRKSGIQVIAGGLIETKQEVTDALGAGATAVSTGQQKLWYL